MGKDYAEICEQLLLTHLIHWNCSGVKSSGVVCNNLNQTIWRLSSEQRKMCFRFSLLTYIDLLTLGIDKAAIDTFFPTWLPFLAVFHNCVKGTLHSAAGAFFFPSPTGYVHVCPLMFWKMTNKLLTSHWKKGCPYHP